MYLKVWYCNISNFAMLFFELSNRLYKKVSELFIELMFAYRLRSKRGFDFGWKGKLNLVCCSAQSDTLLNDSDDWKVNLEFWPNIVSKLPKCPIEFKLRLPCFGDEDLRCGIVESGNVEAGMINVLSVQVI